MTSIMNNSSTGRLSFKLWSIIFWLTIWQIASHLVGSSILLVSPLAVVERFFTLAFTASLWQAVFFSLFRIATGFVLALLLGVVAAALSARYIVLYDLFAPLILAMKAIPVASFIILILIWISSRNLSIIISFIMVMPVIYTNVLDGIHATDRQLLEMVKVFAISPYRQIRYIYLPQIFPFFLSSCSIGLGLCWKSGIAAEVIGIPKGSIGEKLYNAKIYLETADLFAWTLVIILISLAFEKLILALLGAISSYLERI